MTNLPPQFVGHIDFYSRQVLKEDDDVVRCQACGAFALRVSWESLPGCARWGCGNLMYWAPGAPEFAMSTETADEMRERSIGSIQEAELHIEVLREPQADDRYTRIRQLGWDVERLQEAHALVVGAGALGNEVLKNLALLGWGHIVVVDMDSIEDSNLARSVLFRQRDVGAQSYKAEVAAQRVREINPDVKITPVVGTVQDCIGLGVFRRMDVVFGCLDNLQARLDVNRACWRTLTPYIDAGLDGINGDVYTFVPPYTSCYGCTVSEPARRTARDRHPCLKVRMAGPKPIMPTAPTSSSLMAAWQTQIAVKHLHGRSVPAGQRIAVFGNSDDCERYRIEPSSGCADHDSAAIFDDAAIVALPQRSESTTLRELAQIAVAELDMGPETTIQFDFDVLLEATCDTCGHYQEFYRRLTSVSLNEIVCPTCHRVMSPRTEFEFDGTESYAGKTLAELGVPPLHILLARNWPRRQYRYVELSDDCFDFFEENLANNPKLLPVRVTQTGTEVRQEWLPMRVPLHAIAAWRAQDWGLQSDEAASWKWTNITQNCQYAASDSLLGRGAQPDDLIQIQLAEHGPVVSSSQPLQIILEE